MVTLLDGPSDVICQAWPEQNYLVPLCFRTPLIIGVLPRALLLLRDAMAFTS